MIQSKMCAKNEQEVKIQAGLLIYNKFSLGVSPAAEC
jgi:hypothetical protein